MLARTKKLWRNETVQTVIVIALIAIVIFGFWFGSQIVLNTKIPPALAVISGSMCIPYGGACDDWLSVNHPFARTLHKGDIVLIQGVDPKDLKTNYPDSDIIVFHNPNDPTELIVHRIIAVTEVNGSLYFSTKGDGNGNKWPETPQYSLDPWDTNYPQGVPQNLIEGKVIMRIPWIGWVAIKMQELQKDLNLQGFNIALPIIIVLILVLIIAEFVIPLLKRRKNQPVQTPSMET